MLRPEPTVHYAYAPAATGFAARLTRRQAGHLASLSSAAGGATDVVIGVIDSGILIYPAGALDRSGGGVKLGTALPYTVLRGDVHRPFVDAFQWAMALVPRMPSVRPFEL
ncbi:hypothetical protein C2845_PM08G06980 [Panicum miliaceum]|uniref:Xylanase inhibitor C-terminal domain-containing protein n=1 Tax=Panicum miliaceum TaxID=4540 RepID=A0A3L6R002_PANMI|nr:hypothetical protein C2845_PM08G06980 [Panicum miliaceum]